MDQGTYMTIDNKGWAARCKRSGLASALLLASAPTLAAEIKLPETTIGAGLRSSFTSTDVDGASDNSNDFALNTARIYLNGTITDTIKFTFNTEYSDTTDFDVIDAIGRFEFSPMFNIWAGRFLPPSDRANLNGPYYSNEWGFATDGIQDGFPFIAAGRDNGVAYWGDFARLKVSAGVFDVPSTMASFGGDGKDVVTAARLQYSFWDVESGYYLNGTYYGAKDILSFGAAIQSVSGDNAITIDGLMEKKMPTGGVLSIAGEYASYDGFGGYGVPAVFTESDGGFGMISYLFAQPVGIGQFQILGKYATASYDTVGGDTDRDTTEFNLNYVMKTFNARLSLFYIDTTFDGPFGTDFTQIGIGLQLQI